MDLVGIGVGWLRRIGFRRGEVFVFRLEFFFFVGCRFWELSLDGLEVEVVGGVGGV